MPNKTYDFISNRVLEDIADAIRLAENSSAGIAPKDFADRVLDLQKYQCLNFYMPNGGTVSLNKKGSPTVVELEYSLDRGQTWVVWQEDNDGNRSLTLTAGQRIYVRNTSETNNGFSTGGSDYYTFAFTNTVEAYGNTNSLLCKNAERVIRPNSGAFLYLFYNCTSLITAPELPCTTISNSCYMGMFQNCTSLITAPELPATNLDNFCYFYMFKNCRSLQNVRTQMTYISAVKCIYDWLLDVSPIGDFYCPAELTITTGASGIPSGWTRHDI